MHFAFAAVKQCRYGGNIFHIGQGDLLNQKRDPAAQLENPDRDKSAEDTDQKKHSAFPNHPPDGNNINRTGKMEDTFEDIFIKRQPDPETGNTFPDRNQHCQLGGSHDQHNKKSSLKSPQPNAKMQITPASSTIFDMMIM